MTVNYDALREQSKCNPKITTLHRFRNIVCQACDFYLENPNISFASSNPEEEKILTYLVKFKDLQLKELYDLWFSLNAELEFSFITLKEFGQKDLVVRRSNDS